MNINNYYNNLKMNKKKQKNKKNKIFIIAQLNNIIKN